VIIVTAIPAEQAKQALHDVWVQVSFSTTNEVDITLN
jgi:hypothetical protein